MSWTRVPPVRTPPPLIVHVLPPPRQVAAAPTVAAPSAPRPPGHGRQAAPGPRARPPTPPTPSREHRSASPARPDIAPSPTTAAPSLPPAADASANAPAASVSGSPAVDGNNSNDGYKRGNGSDANGGDGQAGASAPAAEADPFRPPASATLHYDTFYNGMPNQTGTIVWSNLDGQRYRLSVAFALPFVGRFAYASEGRIGTDGLAPDRYTEERSRRDPVLTQFDRLATPPQARFSRGAAPLALPAGAQDRFSVLIQLAALINGAPARYRPGVAHRFFVLDSNSGEPWTMVVAGEETVMSHGQAIPALHLVRAPRREGDTRRIDVWLAGSMQWLPVRLVQTEPDGTQIELRWRPPNAVLAPAGDDEPMRGS